MSDHAWKRRFVAFVESKGDTEKALELRVKIPRAMADAVMRECAQKGSHPMVYYCDAFAVGLSEALTAAEPKVMT